MKGVFAKNIIRVRANPCLEGERARSEKGGGGRETGLRARCALKQNPYSYLHTTYYLPKKTPKQNN